MKILSIKVKNLASIGEAFIDFTTEPLSSTGIFAITGPTGAGKSTLLDAMCLALYGKTPRYDLARESGVDLKDISGHSLSQGDVKSILRDGAASGHAEVVFVGLDKHHYRAEWHVKRSRESATGKLQPETIMLTNLNTGAVLGQRKTETLAAIERIIGLNFHQFTRSVLLAQGDFTAFLKADKDSKASLLEKLTGTEIYSEISKTVFEKSKEAGNEIKGLDIQLQGIEILEEQALEDLATEQETINKTLVISGNEVGKIETGIQWYETLESLKTQASLAEKAKKEAEVSLEKVKERKLILLQVEEVQAIRPNFERNEQAITDLIKKKEAHDTLSLSITTLQNELEAIIENINKVENEITHHKALKKEHLPLLSEARRLDTILLEKKTRIKQIEEDYDKHIEKETILKDTLFAKDEEIGANNTIVDKLTKWYQENKSRQPIAENIALINSKLKDGSAQLKAIFEENEKLKACENKLKTGQEEIVHIQEGIDQQKKVLHKVNQNIEALNGRISGISIEELITANTTLAEMKTNYVKAGSHWNQLYETIGKCKLIAQKLANLRLQVEDQQEALQTQTGSLEKAKIEKDYAAKTLAKSQLQVAEKVESLRAQLKEGEECPVCGSLEHPFTLHNSQLDFLLENLEKDSLDINAKYELILKECTVLNTSIRNSKRSMEETAGEKDIKEKLRQQLNTAWLSLPIEKMAFQMPREEVSGWLAKKEKEITEEIAGLQTQVNDYNTIKKQLEATAKEKNQSEMTGTVLTDRLNEVKSEIRSSGERSDQINKQIKKSIQQFEEIVKGLDPFFHHTQWVENWKSNETGFAEKINLFAQSWVENNQLLNEHNQALNQLLPLEKMLKKQLHSLVEESAKKQADLETAVKETDKLSGNRLKIFDGENADLVEERLQNVLEGLEKSVESNKKKSDNLKTTLTTNTTNAQSLVKTIRELEENHNKEAQWINKWLVNYNDKSEEKLATGYLPVLLNYGTDWIKEERSFFEKLTKVIVETTSLSREKYRVLEAHQSSAVPENTLAELQSQQAEVKKRIELISYRKNEIQILLGLQAVHKSKFEKLHNQIEEKKAVFEKWSKLNDLIGSADGRKFRSIAQEYTLDILLLHANHHLEFLSRRYILSRIEDTLGLQVADLDMGGEIRTVYSLSGGESFLVSLALALGLASLSADKMQVESLFIDEGFGSLDPQTLDMAMDALDRLHQQGRKVGVISHVQEMKERITTQIQVEKLANGKSKIVIVS